MQCKDIPDRPILEMLALNPEQWHQWDVCYEPNKQFDVMNAMPEGTPPRLALAKMRMMIRRGVVGGCPCGCRGDFTITDEGLLELDPGTSPPRKELKVTRMGESE